MKIKWIYVSLICVLLLFSACAKQSQVTNSVMVSEPETENITTLIQETVMQSETTTTEQITSTEILQTEESDVQNFSIDDVAKVFADCVYTELENNKQLEMPTVLKVVDNNSAVMTKDEADIVLIDTDFDGIPELLAGGHGMSGTGRYSVYAADGSIYGNDMFTWFVDEYCVVQDMMYAPSGSNSSTGYTKLCQGLPSISINGTLSKEELNTVIVSVNGKQETKENLTYDEVKELYTNVLGVDYDLLQNSNNERVVTYVRGLLQVPDVDNYTKEDIYKCLLELLTQYTTEAE